MILDLCSFTWLLAHQISDGGYICSVWRWCQYNRSELYKMKEPLAAKQPPADTNETLLGHKQHCEARKKRTCATKKVNFLSFQGPLRCLHPSKVSLHPVASPSRPSVSELFMIKGFPHWGEGKLFFLPEQVISSIQSWGTCVVLTYSVMSQSHHSTKNQSISRLKKKNKGAMKTRIENSLIKINIQEDLSTA